jgi:hypothetical protein
MTFGSIDKDRDREKIIAVAQLAAMKHRLRGRRKLFATLFATLDWATAKAVHVTATTIGAIWLAAVVAPPDLDELRQRLLIRHARNGAQRERPGGCGEEEVLRHDAIIGVTNTIEYDGNRHHCQQQK